MLSQSNPSIEAMSCVVFMVPLHSHIYTLKADRLHQSRQASLINLADKKRYNEYKGGPHNAAPHKMQGALERPYTHAKRIKVASCTNPSKPKVCCSRKRGKRNAGAREGA